MSRGERKKLNFQVGRRPGTPLGLGSLDLVFGEAALAADLITAAPKSPKTIPYRKETKKVMFHYYLTEDVHLCCFVSGL